MYIHQSLKGNMIAQDSECPSLMVKPTFCGQTRKVGNVPEADLRTCGYGTLLALFLTAIRVDHS